MCTECQQGASSEALRSSKVQMDSLHDRLTLRIQGTLQFFMLTVQACSVTYKAVNCTCTM